MTDKNLGRYQNTTHQQISKESDSVDIARLSKVQKNKTNGHVNG